MKDTPARRAISAIPLVDQAQYSTRDQCVELYYAAVRLGLYEAADVLLSTGVLKERR